MNLFRFLRLLLVVALTVATANPARAQMTSSAPAPGWSFAVAPYAWLPTISTNLQGNAPRAGTLTASSSAGILDYLSDVNFAAMIGGVARYDRFSVMTDLVYLNASLTSDRTHLSSFNPGPGPIDIPRSQQFGTGTRSASTIWSLAGGYTLLQGDWGNVDAVGGMRMLSQDSTTNYQLNADILLPDRTIGLQRGGTLKVNKTYFDGVGGVTGRINIPNSKFYLPYYFDAGSGEIPLTWQAYGGVGYAVSDAIDLSAGYRYLTFENGGGSGVRRLSLGGAILVANFRF
jgi:opacity protein-like surface antigen